MNATAICCTCGAEFPGDVDADCPTPECRRNQVRAAVDRGIAAGLRQLGITPRRQQAECRRGV